MRVQTVVQHHPARAHLLPSLLAALPAGAQAVVDPAADDARRSPWRTYLACLQALEPSASHLLVVQDDVEACLDLTATLDRIARRHPAGVVTLFVPGTGGHARKLLAACADGRRYVELDVRGNYVPCVATLWPATAVESILTFTQGRPFPPERTADDGNLGEWAQRTQTPILAAVPSLFDHPDIERSLIGKAALAGRNPARVACCWAAPPFTPAGLDW